MIGEWLCFENADGASDVPKRLRRASVPCRASPRCPWEGFNDLLGRPQRFLADGTLYISCVTMPAGYGALRAMGLININPFEWAMR
jgi:hypothetical protein